MSSIPCRRLKAKEAGGNPAQDRCRKQRLCSRHGRLRRADGMPSGLSREGGGKRAVSRKTLPPWDEMPRAPAPGNRLESPLPGEKAKGVFSMKRFPRMKNALIFLLAAAATLTIAGCSGNDAGQCLRRFGKCGFVPFRRAAPRAAPNRPKCLPKLPARILPHPPRSRIPPLPPKQPVYRRGADGVTPYC